MASLFERYRVIDIDTHITEPADVWTSRLPKKWGDQVPHVKNVNGTDLWFIADKPVGMPGAYSAAGHTGSFPDMRKTYADIPPAMYDAKARLAFMDDEKIWANVLYPNVGGFGAGGFLRIEDPALVLACVRAYNDWLLGFCKPSGGRLIGQAILPTTGLEDSIHELEYAMKSGHKGAVISSFPNGSLFPKSDDEPFWARAEEAGFPICVHIGSFLRSAPAGAPKGDAMWKPSLGFVARAAWTKAGGQTLDVTCDLLFSGIFERHPRLRILLVESNIGWIPTLLEQADDMYRRYRWWTGAHEEMTEMPSRIFHRNFWATFMVDRSGIELRHRMNVDHLMWSTDYPHSGCDWPDSGLVIERVFEGVPRAQVRKMLHENAKRLYQLDHVPDRLPG